MALGNFVPRMFRGVAVAALVAVGPLFSTPAVAADPAPFDLPGPALRINVTRGTTTLPIGEVPSLASGDRLTIAADLPEDQRAHFLLLAAFLNGATNPPPKKWVHTAQTWKEKDKDRTLSLTVPEGARQMVMFLVPDTGGAEGAITDAVRGRPGEFVRATQELNQASLDRSRLNAFMAAIRAQENIHPEFLRSIAPTLARSLGMKLNAECLAKVIELQAACLLENRDSLVLADVHSSSMAQTLAGAPTDLALQLSYTREGGLGYYSPYIAVVRDLARVFGAFNNPQLRYLPTLSLRSGAQVSLLLNTAPSFSNPKSVLVAAMPSIGSDSPPRLLRSTDAPICGTRPGLLLPVEGAPIIYSTGYARDMRVRLTSGTGQSIELPIAPRADRGGYVLTRDVPAGVLHGRVKARILGSWGFAPFDGPEFELHFPDGGAWSAGAEAPTLVSGRENALTLTGPAAACVTGVTLRRGEGKGEAVPWKLEGGALAVTVPAGEARPGEVTLEIAQAGGDKPAQIKLRAFAQASRLDAISAFAGDRAAELTGQRLDQVASVELGGVTLRPGALVREGSIDRLKLAGEGGALAAGGATARVTLKDGRTLSLPLTVAAARPAVALLSKSLSPKGAATGPKLAVTGDDLLPDSDRLVFSIRAGEGTQLLPTDAVEVATESGAATVRLEAGPAFRLQGPDVGVATLDPASFGPSTYGALRFRLVRGGVASDWQKLATLARLPQLAKLECGGEGCTLRGQGLFLIAAVASSPAFERGVAVPNGYTAETLAVPAPVGGKLYVKLRDAPEQVVVLEAS